MDVKLDLPADAFDRLGVSREPTARPRVTELIVVASRSCAERIPHNRATLRLRGHPHIRLWWPSLRVEALSGLRLERVTICNDLRLDPHSADFIRACTLQHAEPLWIDP